ncbi:MAG: ATP-binding cassette domain-containing protein [Parcubacteria group bacterium]|nr:ATP-binding cassette domain-containing protein [Parcubacteria group bacterium]
MFLQRSIEVTNLTRRFGEFTAVDSVSFSVGKGEFFGFVGPNGAGKTTTISMLATLLTPTAGEITVNGFDAVHERDKVRASIGLIFQDPSLDVELTAWETLFLHAIFYNVPRNLFRTRVHELLRLVELEQWKDKIVKSFSGGMKRRLEIVRGLLHHPKVLFLDEPTIGLDPQTRALIWQYLKNFRAQEDVTIFVTTHYLPETEHCDHVAIIDKGTIVAYGTPPELKERYHQSSMDAVFMEATGHGVRDEELSSEAQSRIHFKQGGGFRR